MNPLACCLVTLLVWAGALSSYAVPLSGKWELIPERSSPLEAWHSLRLAIAIEGQQVRLVEIRGSGRREIEQVAELDLTRSENLVPIDLWAPSRYVGAQINPETRSKIVRGSLAEEGRLLYLHSEFELAVQQGIAAVCAQSIYTVSADGQELTWLEIRSTRSRPFIFVFGAVLDKVII